MKAQYVNAKALLRNKRYKITLDLHNFKLNVKILFCAIKKKTQINNKLIRIKDAIYLQFRLIF